MEELEQVVKKTLEELKKRYEIYLDFTLKINKALKENSFNELKNYFYNRDRMIVEIDDINKIFIPVEDYFIKKIGKPSPSWKEIMSEIGNENLDKNYNALKKLLDEIKKLEEDNAELIKINEKNIEKYIKDMRNKYIGIKNYSEKRLEIREKGEKARFIDKKL